MDEISRLIALMESMIAVQNQPSPPPATPPPQSQCPAPNDFTEMVNMGTRLEEGAREGWLSRDEASTSKKYGGSFSKRKEGGTNAVSMGKQRRPLNPIQPRNPPYTPEPLPWWFKPDLHCAFHQGAPGYDIENYYPLKNEVQKLIKSDMMSFEDRAPNVKENLLPAHGNASVNMVDGCPGNFRVFDVRHIRQSLVEIHRTLCLISNYEHDHDGCVICSVNPQGCVIVKRGIQKLIDEGVIQSQQSRYKGNDVNVIVPVLKTLERVVIQFDNIKIVNRLASPLVIWLAGPIPYEYDKHVPYKYNATMIKNGQEVPLPTANSVVSIADVVKVTRSGRVFGPVSLKVVEYVTVGKKTDVPAVNAPTCQPSESSRLKINDDDELLMNSEAHIEALQKILEHAYIEHDVAVDQFDPIVANITSCNNLRFYDEELSEEGRNHNLALHISMNCKEDTLSNVLVDTGSLLNVLPKSNLARLSYQGAPMRYSGMVVMEIHLAYICLLGRPWIHKAGAVTSTLHQKLKFVKNGKLVIIGGEKALLVSHLSSFTYVEAKEKVGTSFQALSVAVETQKTGASMSSLKDARDVVQAGGTDK
ncbi:uncharacterized protein LOC127101595 [Lathyrus oleraceus]|uniref:uncharacterized protein LOC127101595 n=1 Tax=Pisum sativum TaxID=3888 RepID=UPI0021CEBC63|nr:uncharacterized protein LOC127101595 [Pisum sativum]